MMPTARELMGFKLREGAVVLVFGVAGLKMLVAALLIWEGVLEPATSAPMMPEQRLLIFRLRTVCSKDLLPHLHSLG
jgi:hypothetical protein